MNTLEINADQHFKLFANCIPVNGASRSVICDLQRNQFDFIPNDFFDFLIEYNGVMIKTIKEDYDLESQSIIDEYLVYLYEKNYIFFCDSIEVNWFPPMDLTWQSPSAIENAIIDIDRQSEFDFKNIILQLEALGCKALELRFFCKYNLKLLNNILAHLEKSSISTVNIIIPFDINNTLESITQLLEKHKRVLSIIFHSFSGENPKVLESLDEEFPEIIQVTEQIIDSNAHCGFISPAYFRIDVKSFTEAQHFNNCLNKKISIDTNGNIKNCPAMPESYGNIADTTLEQALNIEGFTDSWNITKDQIETCKTCEFRYLCSDCRAFTNEQSDPYAKPLKCNYDPKTMTWAEL